MVRSPIARSSSRASGFSSEFHQVFRDVRLHGELFCGGWVSLAESVQHLLKAGEELVGSHYLGRVGVCGQRDRLSNGRDCARYASSLDLFAATVIACPDASGKAFEEADSD